MILDGCDGSLVNLVNMVNLVKWLSYNLDPRLRHSGTSSTGLFGVYLLIRRSAVLRYISVACWRFMLACWLTYGYFNMVSNIVNKKMAKKAHF